MIPETIPAPSPATPARRRVDPTRCTRLHTVQEAAKALHVSERAVYGWLAAGRLRGVRVGRAWRVRGDALAQVLTHGLPEKVA